MWKSLHMLYYKKLFIGFVNYGFPPGVMRHVPLCLLVPSPPNGGYMPAVGCSDMLTERLP